MEVNETYKAFLGVRWPYLITCTFTLQEFKGGIMKILERATA